MLMSGTRMTVPVTCAGSSAAISFSMAIMETYSVPWAPETSARTLPGLAPFTTTTGILVPASTPGGTSRYPVVFCPGAAEAEPTVKACWAAPAEMLSKWAMRTHTNLYIIRVSIDTALSLSNFFFFLFVLSNRSQDAPNSRSRDSPRHFVAYSILERKYRNDRHEDSEPKVLDKTNPNTLAQLYTIPDSTSHGHQSDYEHYAFDNVFHHFVLPFSASRSPAQISKSRFTPRQRKSTPIAT